MDNDRYRQELRLYRSGLLVALLLTAVPTVLVQWAGLSPPVTLGCVLLLVLIQIVVHFYCFLHVGTRSKRDETGVLLFSALIVLLMAGGTLLVFFDQMQRM